MSDKRIEILKAGLTLYNDLGLANVSQRQIATHLQISPGNLTYHFKKKVEICEALYFEFITKVQSEVSAYLKREKNLKSFSTLIEIWFKIMHEYRFIFLDLPSLTRNNLEIRKSYLKFIEVRKSVFLSTIEALAKNKTIRPQEIESEYEMLYERLHIISDFYLSSMVSGRIKDSVSHLDQKNIFLSSLYPYLTKKGKNQYQSLI